MAVSKNDQVNGNEQGDSVELQELKKSADNLGVEYSDKIGFATLEKRVNLAEDEKHKAKKAAPKQISDVEVKKLVATSLSKVMVTNLDQASAGKETAYASCHNMHIDLARAVPLGMEIALEEALILNLEAQKTVISVPVIVNGKDTGNTKAQMAPMYAVARLA